MENKIDLSKCKPGDTLISSQGAKLEYVSTTPYKHYTYLDHVVRYIEDKDGNSFAGGNFGTRTNDGFVFAKNRCPDSDHDIVEIRHKKYSKRKTNKLVTISIPLEAAETLQALIDGSIGTSDCDEFNKQMKIVLTKLDKAVLKHYEK